MTSGDTIAAISSAIGPAVRMILRISGPTARSLVQQLTGAADFIGGASVRRIVSIAGLRFPAWVYTFVGARSYTGEDLAEFHIPGNPLLARLLLGEIVQAGARHAEPGEFTARAYFNGRMDLAEAEGVAAQVTAQNEQELRAGRALLAGELARRLRPPMDLLAETLALVEAGIDFVEEDISFLSATEVQERIARVESALAALLSESARFERLSHEPRIVLVGRPNAGKSTLLNALAGKERAVVSPVAGTTRDVLSAEVALRRGIVHLTDVAGLEEPASHDSSTPADVECQMQSRARRALAEADLVVRVRDATDPRPDLPLDRRADLVVLNKIDLLSHDIPPAPECLTISAEKRLHLDLLRERLDELAFGAVASGGGLALNARHLQAINDARAALARARQQIESGGELLSLELREALDALGLILGVVTPDELLGRIFAKFCIGK